MKTFLIWVGIFNWPPVLAWVPFFQLLSFLPFLFWINIPVQWLGLGILMGKQHYIFEEFGALPQTPLSWILIVVFWVLMSVVMTAATELLKHNKGAGGNKY